MARKFARHAAIYSVESVLTIVLPLLLTPIFLTCLSTAQYGVMELLNNASALAYNLLKVGLGAVVVRVYLQDLTREQDRGDLMITLLLFEIVLGGGFLAVCALNATRLSVWLIGSPAYGLAAVVAFASAALLAARSMPLEGLRYIQRGGPYIGVLGIHAALLLALNGALVIAIHGGVLGVEVAAAAAAAGSLPWAIVFFRDKLRGRFNPRLLRSTLALSTPMLLLAVGPWILNLSDRFFIVHTQGEAITGIYAFGYKLGNLSCQACRTAIHYAWIPLYYAMPEAEGEQAYRRVVTLYVALLAFCILLTAAGSPLLVQLLHRPDYLPSLGLIMPVGMAYIFDAVGTLLNPIFLRVWTPMVTNGLVIGAAAINLALNITLIPRYGMTGAVISTLVGFGFYGLGAAILATWKCGLRLELWNLAGVGAIAGAAGWAMRGITTQAMMAGLGLRLGVVALYLLATGWLLLRDPRNQALLSQLRRRKPAGTE